MFPFVTGQFNEARHFRVGNFHQGILIRDLLCFGTALFVMSLFGHSNDQIQTTVADEGPDIIFLDHHRSQERKDFLIKEVLDKRFMERFRPAVKIQMNVLTFQFGYDFPEDPFVFLLLPIHFTGDFSQSFFGFFRTLFGITLLHNHTPMFGHTNFIEFLQIG